MKITRVKKLDWRGIDSVVIPVFQEPVPESLWRQFPELKSFLTEKKMHGKSGEEFVFHSLSQGRWLIVQGAGKAGDLIAARKLAKKTIANLQGIKSRSALIYLAAGSPPDREWLITFIDYLWLNRYRFDRYRHKKETPLQRIRLFLPRGTSLTASLIRERALLEANVSLVRDLVNDIPALINPDSMVETSRRLAAAGGMTITVWRRPELEQHGMNGLLAVGGDACCQPALVQMEYAPAGYRRTVAVVGKGITFDAGGLNIKTGDNMEEMKSDMAGAAVVLAVLKSAAELRLPVRLFGLAAIAENMPAAKAYKPGDIIRYANRKNVEVVNTDAEGRLILADALIVAARLKPDLIVEFSTLTGAIVTALGDSLAGLMCRNRKLAAQLLKAGERSGELLWELPLFGEYEESISSKIADLKNANYNGASSLKAGLFLNEFTAKVPFAHLDIAGTAFLSKPNYCLATEGATGFGVRMMIDFLKAAAG